MGKELAMFCGTPTLCLKVNDLAASKRFYEALGFVTLDEYKDLRVVVRRGHFTIALMTFLDANCLNLRGADVGEVYEKLKPEFPELAGELDRYKAGDYDGAEVGGACWLTEDPDGNVIFFDTNENEQGADYTQEQTSQILGNTEQALMDIGADEECLAAFRTVLEKFGAPG